MSKTLVEIVVSWGPMILLIVVWIYYMNRGGIMKAAARADLANQLLGEQVAQVKSLNDKLDRIALALERTQGPKA